ncbi:MAG: glycosyltransferase [Candidatus Yanofskybacteria bacterium]|nr:glycosyltransferase [Candidatus Yanofskybacteria bacterium]
MSKKIALVHDWLLGLGGAERVLHELHEVFPEAPVYTLFASKRFVRQFLPNTKVFTSFLQKFPFITRNYRFWAALMPLAVESFDLSEYDVVISSSVLFSKGLIVRPKTKHICYCYSPARPLWDRSSEYAKGLVSRHLWRIWDRQASDRVDEFVSISKTIQERIKKYYGKDSRIIYPPNTLEVQAAEASLEREPYYLIVARLFPHKNIELAIDVFNKLGQRLIVIGDGPLREKLQELAGPTVRILGPKDDETVATYYKYCRALIMPQEEDFGLTSVEAMMYGKPVLALRKGGAVESIIEGETGEFFDDPIPQALADGVRRLNERYDGYDKQGIIEQAKKFSREKFRSEILSLL